MEKQNNEILENLEESKTDELLPEESFSRIWAHLESGRPFALISACRDLDKENPTQEEIDAQKKQNLENTQKLESLIHGAGFGYGRVIGSFKETSKDDSKEEYISEVKETSFMVVALGKNQKRWDNDEDEKEAKDWEERLYKFCIEAGREFNQEAVLFFGFDKKGVYLYTGGLKDEKPYIYFGENDERIIYGDDERSKYEFANLSRVDEGGNYTGLRKCLNRIFKAKRALKSEVDYKQNCKDFFTKYFKDKKYESVLIEKEILSFVFKVYKEQGYSAVMEYYAFRENCSSCWDSKTKMFDWERLKELTNKYNKDK